MFRNERSRRGFRKHTLGYLEGDVHLQALHISRKGLRGEGPDLLPLVDLDILCKQEVMAKAKL